METEQKEFFVRNATGLTKEISGKSAMIGNIHAMGVSYFFVFAFFALLLYPGVNLPLTVLVTLVPGLIIAAIYYLFTVAMPRTGGDYVWVSRVIHPAIGFLTNFFVTFTLLSSISVGVAWGVIYGLSPMLAGIGLVNHDAGLVSLAGTLASTPTSFLLTVILQSIFVLLVLGGTKNVFRVFWVLFGVALLGALVTIIAFYSAPVSTFTSNFNSLSGMNYAQTITTAGLTPGFTIAATLTGSIFTITNFLGFFTSAYYTGEVKRVSRSQVIAMFGSLLVLAIIAILIYLSVYYSAGSDFLKALSFLAGSGSSSYVLPAAPVLNFLVTFAAPNPNVIFLSGLALVATGLATGTIWTFVCVRNIFAWSFDRVMPKGLTNLDSRGSPYVAVITIWILSIIFTYVFFYTSFFSYYVYATLGLFLAFILVSIAAIAFPYRKKDIFESSPPSMKRRVAGIPVIVILGILGLVSTIYLSYATLQPAVTPPPSGPPLIQLLAYAIVPLTGAVALLIYAAAYYYRKSKGFNLALTFKEIPPE